MSKVLDHMMHDFSVLVSMVSNFFLVVLPKSLRACLHGVGWGKFLLFSRSGGHKTKETYPTRPGSPTPCKQGLYGKSCNEW